jgi:hypothetical protein
MKKLNFVPRAFTAVRSSILFSALVAAGALGSYPNAAQAVPSMARQTGVQPRYLPHGVS